jgi:hypothetical protein
MMLDDFAPTPRSADATGMSGNQNAAVPNLYLSEAPAKDYRLADKERRDGVSVGLHLKVNDARQSLVHRW